MRENKETAWYINGKKLPTYLMIVGCIVLFGAFVDGLTGIFSLIKSVLF